MLKVLMYIFESYMNQALCSGDAEQRPVLEDELIRLGFDPVEVTQAIEWLDEFDTFKTYVGKNSQLQALSTRFYAEDEKIKIGPASRGLIYTLEKRGILRANMREIVISCLMALAAPEVEVADVKWVTLMVLFHHPEEKEALALMQDWVVHGDNIH